MVQMWALGIKSSVDTHWRINTCVSIVIVRSFICYISYQYVFCVFVCIARTVCMQVQLRLSHIHLIWMWIRMSRYESDPKVRRLRFHRENYSESDHIWNIRSEEGPTQVKWAHTAHTTKTATTTSRRFQTKTFGKYLLIMLFVCLCEDFLIDGLLFLIMKLRFIEPKRMHILECPQ